MFSYFALGAFTLASAANVVLVVESSDKSLAGKYISNIHFGAAINGAILSDSPVTYKDDGSQVWQNVEIADGTIPFILQEDSNVLVAAANNSSINAKPVDDYLTINGTNTAFYACSKLAWDPYGYVNAENRGVGIYGKDEHVPDGCTPIKIRADQQTDSSSEPSSTVFSTQWIPVESGNVTSEYSDISTNVLTETSTFETGYNGSVTSDTNWNTITGIPVIATDTATTSGVDSSYFMNMTAAATASNDTAIATATESTQYPASVDNSTSPTETQQQHTSILANSANKQASGFIVAVVAALLL